MPYYLNLAPNYDLTLEPRYMSERGTQVRSDFRYLLPQQPRRIRVRVLARRRGDEHDAALRQSCSTSRCSAHAISSRCCPDSRKSPTTPTSRTSARSLAVTSQTHLNRFLDLTFFAPNWSLLTRLQNYQTIDPVLTDAEHPYERVPQMVFGGRWRGRLLRFDSDTELVNFDRNVGTTGWRLDSTQELSLRFARSGMFLTPAIALRQTNYWIDNPAPGEDDLLRRGLPIGSLDMGMKFERDTDGGRRNWVQTLEPRLLYVHVPFEDQSALPVFDTIVPDFNLIQLFRKYQFVGPDRIADTDQLCFGVTTRLIDAANGRERLTATLGQTRYLNPQLVTLPGTLPTDTDASDYVAEVGIGIRDAWALDVGYQWNSETSIDGSHRNAPRVPPEGRSPVRLRLSLPARTRSSKATCRSSGPLAERWRIIGRYSYSFLDKERLEDFIGWEYEACCWRLRMVNRNYVSRRTGETDSSISLQLELKGLSQRGHGAGRAPRPWYSGLSQYRPSLLRRAIP